MISKRLGEAGQVLVRITVARDGRAISVAVVNSSGHPRLDRAAIETIERWRFTPFASGDARTTPTVLHRVTSRLR